MTSAPQSRSLLARLRQETTPRTIAGLVALALILAVLGISELAAHVGNLKQDVDELRRDRNIQSALMADDGWIERSQQAEASVAETRERFWTGRTPGIVVAQLQGEVEAAGRRANFQNMRVSIQPDPVPLGENAFVFEISLTARDVDGQFLAFFQEIVRTQGYLVPTAFEWSRLNGQLSIRLDAPAIVGQDNIASESAS